ncbi:hypothetical protein KEM54_000502 [Ascosphaera aggregata]|nr:hypothetical protein KEM54_000502 [Ascosphaera aggregata]
MRDVEIFAGSSHRKLTEAICERLGATPAKCKLGKFSNGETTVEIGVSVRNKDVFIVQSGCEKINDAVMELLIMINACKGGSAKSVTEPLIARWIRLNVPQWRHGVVVSKNAGGSKRVTSLADTLKLNFGIVTTERRRKNFYKHITESAVFFDTLEVVNDDDNAEESGTGSPPSYRASQRSVHDKQTKESRKGRQQSSGGDTIKGIADLKSVAKEPVVTVKQPPKEPETREEQEQKTEEAIEQTSSGLNNLVLQPPAVPNSARRPSERFEWNDVRAADVIRGRLVQGQLVDDDYPSPILSSTSGTGSVDAEIDLGPMGPDPMASSIASFAQPEHALGGSYDAADASSDDEEDKLQGTIPERTITLVGDVRDRTVFIIDDMIDTPQSWVAAAETVVKRGGAKTVYCIATHGLFGEDCLDVLDECVSIDKVVVTNTFPLPKGFRKWKKLVVIDSAALLSEGIRRHHYGER